MKRVWVLFALLFLLAGLVPAALAQEPTPDRSAAELVGETTSEVLPPAAPVEWAAPEAVLWDNGPMVTHPGGGAGGADASALQTALGMTIYGFGHQLSYNYRVADDFDITDPGGWDIEEIIFFAYQTGSPTAPSPINHVNYQIWDGPPNDPASSVVFGDTATNRLIDSTWSNIYRVLDTDLLNTNRPTMADTCSAGVHLDPGTYWLDWQTGGTLTSGPWAPPVTILGQTTTGNAMQSLDGGASWAALSDVGFQGLPFLIEGTVVSPIAWDKFVDGEMWYPGITITRQTSDTIIVQEVLHLTPPPPPEQAGGIMAITFDGSPGVNAPPPTLGPYTMTPFPADGRPLYADYTDVPGPTGPILFDIPVNHRRIGDGWATWSHGYTGDVYFSNGATQLVITLPPGTSAFYFYVEPDPFEVHTFTATAQDGTTSGPIPVDGNGGAKYFGFYATGGDVLMTITIATDVGFAVGEFGIAAVPVFAQIETWEPAHLQLVDWEATGGDVISGTGRLVWTGPILEPATITLTKWFHVEPCTWTETLLWEELWLDGVELEQRPVLINKLPPELWIDSIYDPLVCPGMPAQFMLDYGNLGAYENDVMVRNDFPPEAPFAGSDPPPDNVDPNGLWAEWLVGDLPQDAQGRITVTVDITYTVSPGQFISIFDWIIDHVGEPADMTEIVFTVGEPVDLLTVTYVITDLTVAFTSQATGSEPIYYLWDFGDGSTSTETNPIYTYAAGGCYSVSLDVANSCGLDSWIGEVCVCDPVAIVTVTADIVGCVVDFGAGLTGTPPFAYLWDFAAFGTSTDPTPTVNFGVSGTYPYTLTVENCQGASSDTWADSVTVNCGVCDPPTNVNFTWLPLLPGVGQVITFDGTANGTPPFTFDWSFDDGGVGAGATVTHTYALTGTYTVVMTATNACGSAFVAHDVTVSEVPGFVVYLPLVFKNYTAP